MPSNFSASQSHLASRQRWFFIFIFLVSLPLIIFVLSMKYQTVDVQENTNPAWFEVIAQGLNSKTKIKIGLINITTTARMDGDVYEQLSALHPHMDIVPVHFDHVGENLKWKDFFPEWIDEDGKWGQPKCPHMPMPVLDNYKDLNVVMAKVPCGDQGSMKEEGIRDVLRLQVNLAVANLVVENGWLDKLESGYKNVYVVFVGSCGPMKEIFKCEDLLMHQGDYWVYKPDLKRLKQQTLMPVGSCQISPGYAETGKELWRGYLPQLTKPKHNNTMQQVPKLAYVTVLHSSEAYVCGAIALAQSILLTGNSIFEPKDLVLLADDSIGPESIRGLRAAGWKIRRIQRILSPFAKKGAYNQWNYSKLRIWQLTMYDKVIFIDSDLLVLKNIDYFFGYPQLSAAPNEDVIFNSGVMVIEPSQCMFENMMQKTSKVKPYNGGDQGFLNEIFTWWHRLPSKLNYMKSYKSPIRSNEKREVPEDVYTVHYLGLKPWMCYRDYDCNWDMQDHHVFASDSAHQRWWQVYDTMPKHLQSHCALTEKMNESLVKHRRLARNASFPDGHWKIEVKDPRKMQYLED